MRKSIIMALALAGFMGHSALAATIIKPPELKISGYTQAGYIRNDATTGSNFTDGTFDDGFKIFKARFTFKAEIDPKVSMNVQFDASARKTTSADVTNLLTDGYFDLKFLKGHNIRLGQFKTPFGLENPISDAKTWTINTSAVKTKCLNTRDIGVVVSSKGANYEYSAGVLNGNGPNKNDNNSEKDYIASAQYTWNNRITVGASGINSPGDSTQTTLRHGYSGFALAKEEWGEVQFEYMGGTDKAALKRAGWYATVVPKVNERTWLVGRYDMYDPNKNTSGNEAKRATFGVLYKTSKYTLVKVNYEVRGDKAVGRRGDVTSVLWQVEY